MRRPGDASKNPAQAGFFLLHYGVIPMVNTHLIFGENTVKSAQKKSSQKSKNS